MIRLTIGSDGSQDIKKDCNVCKNTIIQDLQLEDIIVKPKLFYLIIYKKRKFYDDLYFIIIFRFSSF